MGFCVFQEEKNGHVALGQHAFVSPCLSLSWSDRLLVKSSIAASWSGIFRPSLDIDVVCSEPGFEDPIFKLIYEGKGSKPRKKKRVARSVSADANERSTKHATHTAQK